MYTISQIAEIINAQATLKQANDPIEQLLLDSRKLAKTENTLFFAIKGNRLNGHHYIADLYQKGLRHFVVEENVEQSQFPEANFLQVNNSIKALQNLSKYHRNCFDIPIIAITGSNGKTIVKEWLYQLLHQDYQIVRSPKSYNSQIGVPLSLWNSKATDQMGIFEAGISAPDEMDNLAEIINPTIGIFTNIGAAHGQQFINKAHKTKEKLKLFKKAKVLIYCKDHTVINQSISEFWAHTINEDIDKPQFIAWSEKVDADIVFQQKKIEKKQCTIQAIFKAKTYHFSIPFTDTSSIENTLHCIVLLLHLGYAEKKINQQLQNLKRIAMRLEQRKGINQCIVINDSYNSDLDSLQIALDFLTQQEVSENKTLIISDILQSSVSNIDLYSAVAEMVQAAQVNKLIGIGKNINAYRYLFDKNILLQQKIFYENTSHFLNQEDESNFSNEAILLKGARNFQFEKINTFLEEKVHSTVFEINLNAILHNLHFFSQKLKPKTKTMAMVKAFAYGSGYYEIAKLLAFQQVDYLGVAYADEGIALRKAGITLPIMVLNPEKRSFDAMIRYRLEPEIYSIELFTDFAEAYAPYFSNEKFPVHINIDTGMKRLGFDTDEIIDLCNALKNNSTLQVASIFSHLAASDEAEWDNFTQKQIKTFEKSSQYIIETLGYKPILHILNSSGIVRFSQHQYDMVRLGLGLYGINAMCQQDLEPAGVLKSSISQLRKVKKGETVGYGRIGKMEKDGTIAVVAIGYADGLRRSLSNGVGSVFIKGKRAKIIGNICMDMTMIDVSEIDDIQIGDEVEIFGKNINVAEVATQANTITYEILTSISERVKRIFFVE